MKKGSELNFPSSLGKMARIRKQEGFARTTPNRYGPSPSSPISGNPYFGNIEWGCCCNSRIVLQPDIAIASEVSSSSKRKPLQEQTSSQREPASPTVVGNPPA